MLDFSRCRLEPFPHQREDVQAVIDHPFYFIASAMRTGKTKIIIDAAQFLFEAGVIDKMIVVAPAAVRDVWYDDRLGELAKHLWLDVPAYVVEYHARLRAWSHGPSAARKLEIYCTNFEFLRSKTRLMQLLPACGPKTMLIGDESSAIKNHAAAQTKAFLQLRRACGRVYLLNGTPVFLNPLDLFSQGNILSPMILDCKFISHFKARYAVMQPVLGYGGKPLQNPHGGPIQKITGWCNLEDIQARFAKHTVRRLQSSLNLPPKLDPVTLTATLTPETWKAYKEMRDEMVIWLTQEKVATSATAAVKALRLSQITSGFLGGVEDAGIGDDDVSSSDRDPNCLYEFHPVADLAGITHHTQAIGREQITSGFLGGVEDAGIGDDDEPGRFQTDSEGVFSDGSELSEYREITSIDSRRAERHQQPDTRRSGSIDIGREKLDVLLWFIGQRLEGDPNFKVVVWCRFVAELQRAVREVRKTYPRMIVSAIHGGQKKLDRLEALALLHPETKHDGPACLVGTAGTGSFGINLTAAHTCITLSSGYSPGQSAQMLDRIYGPGMTEPVSFYDIVAVGPKNQRTIDHAILVARRAGADVASWTASAWVRALTEE